MKTRLRIFLSALLIIFFILVYRIYDLIFDSPLPYWQSTKVEDKIRRGTIYDANNNILALSVDSVSIGIRPTDIKSLKQPILFLEKITQIPKDKIIALIEKNQDKSFFWLKRRIPIDLIPNYQKIKIAGVDFQTEPSRFYPNGSLASNVIGFSGIDNEGLSGLEFKYNDVLTSKDMDTNIGKNLHLSLNSFMQHILEKYLDEAFKNSQSKGAVGIISETHSGKILAMASLPNFNPLYSTEYNQNNYKNRTINDVYEPGSTFKIFILATLAQQKLLNDQEKYFCPGFIEKNSFKIRCTGIHKSLNMHTAIQKSCNTAIITAASRLSANVLAHSLSAFGFGKPTGIDLPGESPGIIAPIEKWDFSLKMSASIGHGIAVTPIQMIMAANSIANGGKIIQPFIVEKVTAGDGKVLHQTITNQKRKIFDSQISTITLNYLKSVVEVGGTGYQANLHIKDLQVAGKTGTSIKSTKDGYLENKYQASFIGFFPLNNPIISVFILLDEPSKGDYQGGSLAAPVFRKVVENILPFTYQNHTDIVLPLKNMNYNKSSTSTDKAIMPNFMGRSKKDIFQIIFKNFVGEHNIQGSGYVIQQYPKPGSSIQKPYKFNIELGFPNNTK